MADEWTTTDTKWELAYQAAWVIDWGQTRYIATHPDEYYETNPFLGDHPSVSEVDRYFIVGGIAHYAISRALPAEYRRPFQMITFGWQLQYPLRNASIGIKVKF